MIRDLLPSLLLVVGVAGAVPDTDFTLGDVIVSSRIHDFGINAYKPSEIQWDMQGGIHPYISEIVATLPMYNSWLQDWNTLTSIGFPRPEIDITKFKNFDLTQLTDEDKQNIFDGTPPTFWQKKILNGLKWNFGPLPRRNPDPIFYVGSIASSGSLIRDSSILIKWLQTARSIRAFEMEAAGVFQAAQQLLKQYPVMTIRGISDIPGLIREDDWKRYACHSAAAFTYAFIKAGIIEPLVNANNIGPIVTSSAASVSEANLPQNKWGGNAKQAIKLYISYSESDQELKVDLEIHLAQLQRQGIISTWHKRQIGLGMVQDSTIDSHIDAAQIILLLVSPHFIASPYCYEKEVLRAMERQKLGDVRVVPILLRTADWRNTPFGQLQPLPRNNKPIVSWEDRDEAWYEVVKELRQLSEALSIKLARKEEKEIETTVKSEQISSTMGSLISATMLSASGIVSKQYKLMSSLREHTGWVRCVAFSPDGHYLASGSDDGTIKLWEVSTGSSIHALKGYANVTSGIGFSPDGRYLASGSDGGTIKLWEFSTGKIMQTFRGHTDWVSCVAFDPDGHYLASGSNDGAIKLWEVPSGKIVHTLEGHAEIYSVAFNLNGRLIAGGSLGKTIKVWEISTGRTVYMLKESANIASSVAFSPDGHYLASGNDDGTIKLWETSTRKAIRTLVEHSSWIRSVVFSPDGQHLASGCDDQMIKLWEVSTGRIVQTLAKHIDRIECVAFSPDGQLIASGGRDKTIILWKIE